MIIYGSTVSPFVRKVLTFATEKGLDFTVQSVGIGDVDPGYRAASPLGKMPALADGDYLLADSSAIVHYLDAKYPAPPLIPADAELRGRTVWWDEFADTVLGGCATKMFFNRVVAPKFLKREGDLAAAALAEKEELPKLIAHLEGAIPASGFLVGDALTLADLAVAAVFANIEYAGYRVDTAAFPKVAAWTQAMLARPSFAKWTAKERSAFGLA